MRLSLFRNNRGNNDNSPSYSQISRFLDQVNKNLSNDKRIQAAIPKFKEVVNKSDLSLNQLNSLKNKIANLKVNIVENNTSGRLNKIGKVFFSKSFLEKRKEKIDVKKALLIKGLIELEEKIEEKSNKLHLKLINKRLGEGLVSIKTFNLCNDIIRTSDLTLDEYTELEANLMKWHESKSTTNKKFTPPSSWKNLIDLVRKKKDESQIKLLKDINSRLCNDGNIEEVADQYDKFFSKSELSYKEYSTLENNLLRWRESKEKKYNDDNNIQVSSAESEDEYIEMKEFGDEDAKADSIEIEEIEMKDITNEDVKVVTPENKEIEVIETKTKKYQPPDSWVKLINIVKEEYGNLQMKLMREVKKNEKFYKEVLEATPQLESNMDVFTNFSNNWTEKFCNETDTEKKKAMLPKFGNELLKFAEQNGADELLPLITVFLMVSKNEKIHKDLVKLDFSADPFGGEACVYTNISIAMAYLIKKGLEDVST